MDFPGISESPTLLKILLYNQVPGRFLNFIDMPSRETSSHPCPLAVAVARRRRCGTRRGKQTAPGFDSTHEGSVGGGFEGGDVFGECARQRAAVTAAAAYNPGEAAAMPGNVR
jgi:hypothetical protein